MSDEVGQETWFDRVARESQPIPSLATFENASESPVGRWFAEHGDAANQCGLHMRPKGIATTHRYLIRYYEFPFGDDALREYALKVGWWTLR